MNSEMQLERMEARGIHNLLEDDIHTDLILSLLSSVHGMHRTRLEERGPQRSMHVHEKSNLIEPEPRFIRMAQRNIFKGHTASWALWSPLVTRQILRDLNTYR